MNLGAEGLMATGAVTGAIVTPTAASPWVGLGAAGVAGAAPPVPFALAVVCSAPSRPWPGCTVVALGMGLAAVAGRA